MGIYKIRTEFGHQLKWLMGLLAVIFVIGGVFFFGGMPDVGTQGPQGNDEVIATVEDMEIKRGELNASWETMYEALRNAGVRSTLQVAQARARLIQQLIGARITLLMAEKLGAPIDERAVEAKREEILVERLRVSRRAVLSEMSSEQERSDPRDDREYRAELRKAGMSLDDVVKQQAAYIPDADIQQALANDGIRKALQRKAGVVTPDDIKNSYNIYSLRMIVIPKSGLPEAQLESRVSKIVAEAKKGSDFASLAKQYTADPAKGKVQEFSYGMVSSEVWDKLSGVKPGRISNPISASQAVYIVKMDSVTQKLPAKFDKKAQTERRNQIVNQRMMEEYMRVQQQMGRPKVDVKDPEMKGYWLLSQAGQAQNATEAKRQLSQAAEALKKAYGDENRGSMSQFPGAMLAMVMQQMGDKANARKLLGQLLEGKNSNVIGADLRIIYADLLLEAGSKADAIKQYQVASESAGPLDGESHMQLVEKFKKVGRSDLAANEQAAVDKYNSNKKLIEAQQAKNAPKAPQPNAPVKP